MPASQYYEGPIQICPQCETPVRVEAKFCHHCGQKFSDSKEEVPTIVCPKCKVPIRKAARFCSRCGRRLPDLKEGDQIGNYVVERLLGAGGIGAVYLSHHKLLKHSVALKVHDYFSFDKDIGQAFLRSSNYLSQMDHPHIVRLYDYGFQGERAYQAIEYIDGCTFAQLIPHQQTKIWVDRCLKYFAQMLSALHYAHTSRYVDLDGTFKRGILHGDIKPQNIFLDLRADAVKLTDFMIPDVQAFLGKKAPNFLQEREGNIHLFSTLGYMAPEQKRGQITPQTDIFSLGVTMYQLLTGWGPGLEGNSPGLRNEVPPIHENPYIPIWLNNVIINAIQRDSSQRFQTVAEIMRIFQNQQDQGNLSLKDQGNDHFYSNRNAVSDEMSSIFTTFSATNQRELVEALKRLKETTMTSNEISDRKKQDLVEVVSQIEEEVTRSEPNITLLRILSSGLLETLRTITDVSLSHSAGVIAPLFTKLYTEQKRMSKTIRILFLAANPKDTHSLRLDQEIRSIDISLRQAEFRDVFDIKQHWALRVTDLQGHLLRHQPDIVHFSGHGSPLSEIILEDNDGNSHPVSPRALSQVFSVLKDNVRCVVLNACYSEHQAQAVAQYIDCVVGMSKAIGDTAAIGFAAAFYQALGYGRNVKTAFDLGCAQIDLENLDEQDTPKLLAINGDPANITFVNDNA